MSVLLFVVGVFVALRLMSKLSKLELELKSVSERLSRLETVKTAAVPITAVSEAPVETAVDASVETILASRPPAPEPTIVSASIPNVAAELPSHPLAAPMPAAQDSLERRIGARWLLYVGVLAIIVGIAYFERLASENGWINDTARVLQGALLGVGLLEAGRRFIRRGFGFYGQVLAGGGVAVLYVTTYAAYNVSALISLPVAFGLMAAVTVLGAWIADRYLSQWLALIAVGGGFLTPFLLPSGSSAQAPLFGYDAILVAGTAFLARRRAWPRLNVVSYLATVLTIDAWATYYYSGDTYLETELFLTLFCAMFAYILRRRQAASPGRLTLEHAVLWSAPVLYYGASLANLYDHSVALLVFLIALSLVGVGAGVRIGPRTRLSAWVLTAFPLLAWSGAHGGSRWLVAGLTTWAAVYLLHLAGFLRSASDRGDQPPANEDIALLHGNGLFTYLGMYLLLEPVRAAAGAPLSASLAVVQLALAIAVRRRREEALHFVALAGALLAIAIGQQFDGNWAVMGWTAEGAGLIYLGLRAERTWLRTGGAMLFAGATLFLLGSLSVAPPVGQRTLLNMKAASGLFVVGLTYLLTLAHWRAAGGEKRAEVDAGLVTGNLLLLAVTSREIVSYWQLHARAAFEPEAGVIIAALLVAIGTIWIGLARRTEWVRGVAFFLLAVTLAGLLSIQSEIAPASYVFLLNARVAAGALAVIGLSALVAMHRRLRGDTENAALVHAVLTTAACVFGLSLLTSEVNAFWQVRYLSQATAPGGSELGRQMTLSIAWASYALLLIGWGLGRRSATLRYVAMAVFGVTIVKVFAVDLASLDRIYRVLSIIGLGIALLATSYLYQRSKADDH